MSATEGALGLAFWPDGSYVLQSPYASFNPNVLTIDTTRLEIPAVTVTLSNDAPLAVPVSVTPVGDPTQAVTLTANASSPSAGSPVLYEGAFDLTATCFGVGRTVTVASAPSLLDLPAQATIDARGYSSISARGTAQETPTSTHVTVTDSLTGRGAAYFVSIPGTTLYPGTSMLNQDPSSGQENGLASHDVQYTLGGWVCSTSELGPVGSPSYAQWETLWTPPGIPSLSDCTLTMQTDGNLVYRSTSHGALWQTGTPHTGSANRMVLQDDGNFVMYTPAQRPVWSLHTGRLALGTGFSLHLGQSLGGAGNALTLARNGQLTIVRGRKVVWATPTARRHVTRLTMQSDGNLVLYATDGRPVWSTKTNHAGAGCVLFLSPSGTASVVNPAGTAVWRNG